DRGLPAVERLAQSLFIVVERLEADLRRLDFRFDAAQARRGVDQILVELAAVGADLLDLAFDRGLGIRRLALLAVQLFEILVVLLEQVELDAGRRLLRRRRGVQDRRQGNA